MDEIRAEDRRTLKLIASWLREEADELETANNLGEAADAVCDGVGVNALALLIMPHDVIANAMPVFIAAQRRRNRSTAAHERAVGAFWAFIRSAHLDEAALTEMRDCLEKKAQRKGWV